MLTLDQIRLRLRILFGDLRKAEGTREKILKDAPGDPGKAEDRLDAIDTDIRKLEGKITALLSDLVRYPPQFDRHFKLLDDFHQKGNSPFEKSVFLMTKFPQVPPDSVTQVDQELQAVIDVVKQAVSDNGFIARLANDRTFHSFLSDNVEL